MTHLLLLAGQFPTSNKKAASSSTLKDLKAPVPMSRVFLWVFPENGLSVADFV
jgi:hypothetical protein